MTEQIETDFWAEERARDAAARGRQADPSACGTCRSAVTAGGQVEHDECAQRATLLPAPDSPGYELLTGLSEEELAALPARFHVPAYMESSSPQMWVCSVCWGDGWVSQWPCKTAVKHGLKIFTDEHNASAAAKRGAAELERLRTERDGFRDQRNAVFKTNQQLVAEVEAAGLARITAENETRRAIHAQRAAAEVAQQENDGLRARVSDLEAELKKYVGAEPTIAEEMAHLSRCLDSVRALCTAEADRAPDPFAIPQWVASVRAAAEGLHERTTYPPVLPWAALMDDDDLSEFLHELASGLVQTTLLARVAGRRAGLEVLADLEKVCATWRPIAEAQHAHNTAPGPDGDEPR